MTAPEPTASTGYTGAFIVCMDDGRFFGTFAADDPPPGGLARATEAARAIGGFVVTTPMVADFREARRG